MSGMNSSVLTLRAEIDKEWQTTRSALRELIRRQSEMLFKSREHNIVSLNLNLWCTLTMMHSHFREEIIFEVFDCAHRIRPTLSSRMRAVRTMCWKQLFLNPNSAMSWWIWILIAKLMTPHARSTFAWESRRLRTVPVWRLTCFLFHISIRLINWKHLHPMCLLKMKIDTVTRQCHTSIVCYFESFLPDNPLSLMLSRRTHMLHCTGTRRHAVKWIIFTERRERGRGGGRYI